MGLMSPSECHVAPSARRHSCLLWLPAGLQCLAVKACCTSGSVSNNHQQLRRELRSETGAEDVTARAAQDSASANGDMAHGPTLPGMRSSCDAPSGGGLRGRSAINHQEYRGWGCNHGRL
ncbi:hypothetical protein P154DRAFT_560768 [Amniculicola lignicola CBS 123094]|uniref:Uncharacterized protein n=1 Tax=Amniculicola lignicola CBS 123094 TaxID=1392246 RepID=A0A6A5WZ10_9PLEO|nr:hypothetical protein P154DRAFT_560768 [Amniculicola lignicola CBS 123094]